MQFPALDPSITTSFPVFFLLEMCWNRFFSGAGIVVYQVKLPPVPAASHVGTSSIVLLIQLSVNVPEKAVAQVLGPLFTHMGVCKKFPAPSISLLQPSREWTSIYNCLYVYMYTHTYVHVHCTHTCAHMYVCMYTHIWKEKKEGKERKEGRKKGKEGIDPLLVLYFLWTYII